LLRPACIRMPGVVKPSTVAPRSRELATAQPLVATIRQALPQVCYRTCRRRLNQTTGQPEIFPLRGGFVLTAPDQTRERLILREECLAGKLREKRRTLQPIHDRALHLREVELDAGVREPVIDRLQTFEGRRVD